MGDASFASVLGVTHALARSLTRLPSTPKPALPVVFTRTKVNGFTSSEAGPAHCAAGLRCRRSAAASSSPAAPQSASCSSAGPTRSRSVSSY